IVELAGLPDDDRPRPDDEDGLDIGAFGHGGLTVRRGRAERPRCKRAFSGGVGRLRPLSSGWGRRREGCSGHGGLALAAEPAEDWPTTEPGGPDVPQYQAAVQFRAAGDQERD